MSVDVKQFVVAEPFEHRVDDNEAAGAADASTAVYHHGAAVGGREVAHPPQEEQEGRWVVGHPVVGPRSELELPQLASLVTASLRHLRATQKMFIAI